MDTELIKKGSIAINQQKKIVYVNIAQSTYEHMLKFHGFDEDKTNEELLYLAKLEVEEDPKFRDFTYKAIKVDTYAQD